MHPTTTLLTLAVLASPAYSATIVQTLSSRPELSLVAAFAKDNADWSGPGVNKTLIAPTNDAVTKGRTAGTLAATASGAFFLAESVDHRTRPNYKILKGKDGAMLFDNYVPDGPPEIHIRSSTNNGLATGQIQCDDGWLYISDIAIEPAVAPSVSAVRGPAAATAFIDLFKSINAVGALDSQKDVTIFAPSNAAIAAAQAQIAALAPNQLAAVLSAHIGKPSRFTTELAPGLWPTLFGNYALNTTVGNEVAFVNDAQLDSPVDTPTSAGALHVINKVIIPPNLPAPNSSPVAIGTVPAGTNATTSAVPSSTTATASAVPTLTATTTTTASAPKATTTTSSNVTSGAVQGVASYVGAFVAGLVGLVFAA
ncbi:hypothetical protein SpCBS45565_g04170 [Spizellomyces sp. 'palustris']|nr:hypothetical protein SpCBS45565_g04170 [Spizellomyces sp. 'palustris']